MTGKDRRWCKTIFICLLFCFVCSFSEQTKGSSHLFKPHKNKPAFSGLQITGAERVKIPTEHGKKRLEDVAQPFRHGGIFIFLY